jgi:hypothetical protein
MLRTVMTDRFRPRLMAFGYTTASGSPVFSQGDDDLASSTDNGAGDTTLTFLEPFARVPVAVLSAGSGVATGAFGNINAVSTASAARLLTKNSAGSNADGLCHGLIYGWDSADTINTACDVSVKNTGLAPRLLPITLSAPSTLVEGKYLASASAVSEVTTLIWARAFQRAPIIIGCATTLGNTVNITSSSVSGAVVCQYDSDGSATTGGMHLFVLGWDRENRIGRRRMSLKVPQLAPRMLAFNITVTGGTPVITGYDGATITDNGVGDFTLTFTKAFLRAPVVVASSSGSGAVAVTASSTTACTVKCSNAAGSAQDPTTVGVLVVGFDNAQQM